MGQAVGVDTYTHGHADAVLRSHRWRTAENSAGYLLPALRPGFDVLDVGCGPGTITVDLARRVAPGRVLGLDVSPAPLDEARALADRELHGHPGATGQRARLVQRVRRDVQPDDPAGRHPRRQVDGDGARTAPHVEDVEPRAQVRTQVPGGVLHRAPAVRLQDGVGVAVRVGVHDASFAHRSSQWEVIPTLRDRGPRRRSGRRGPTPHRTARPRSRRRPAPRPRRGS